MYKIPRYLNKPLTYVGLEREEVILLYMCGGYGFLIKSWVAFFVGASLSICLIKIKRDHPPGFLKHILYSFCLYKMSYYPRGDQKYFIE